MTRPAVPETFETARLRAERLRPEHADLIHAMHRDPVHMATLGGVRTVEQSAEYMRRNLQHWADHGFGVWLLRDRESGRVAGRVLLRYLELNGTTEVEVGYSLLPEFWGQGLAAEAAGRCLEIGRDALKLTRVIAVTSPDNVRSRRVMEKLGMVHEGEGVHAGLPHVRYAIGLRPRVPSA